MCAFLTLTKLLYNAFVSASELSVSDHSAKLVVERVILEHGNGCALLCALSDIVVLENRLPLPRLLELAVACRNMLDQIVEGLMLVSVGLPSIDCLSPGLIIALRHFLDLLDFHLEGFCKLLENLFVALWEALVRELCLFYVLFCEQFVGLTLCHFLRLLLAHPAVNFV